MREGGQERKALDGGKGKSRLAIANLAFDTLVLSSLGLFLSLPFSWERERTEREEEMKQIYCKGRKTVSVVNALDGMAREEILTKAGVPPIENYLGDFFPSSAAIGCLARERTRSGF